MKEFTFEERQLISLYNTGDRLGTIAALQEMLGYLEADETELAEMTDSAIEKLHSMTEDDFESMDLAPDFIEEDK